MYKNILNTKFINKIIFIRPNITLTKKAVLPTTRTAGRTAKYRKLKHQFSFLHKRLISSRVLPFVSGTMRHTKMAARTHIAP